MKTTVTVDIRLVFYRIRHRDRLRMFSLSMGIHSHVHRKQCSANSIEDEAASVVITLFRANASE